MYRFPPKRVLVACDLSAPTAAAWRQAVSVAERFGASLEAVHVRRWMRAAELAPLPPPDLSPEEEGKLLVRFRQVIGAEPKITFLAGDPALGILRAARASRADLIVMGTHGRTGLRRVLLGSVAEAVARRSTAPVLVVRGGGEAIRSILAPVNFTDYSDHGFEYAAALAAAMNAGLTALHVRLDPIWTAHPELKLGKLLGRLPAASRAACRSLVETGQSEATEGILKAGDRHDIIVLVAHENSRLKEMVLGTTAERVLRGSKASVLVVPAPRRPRASRAAPPLTCCAAVE
jgi:nucleotide-binding universal stress UspA family protein